MFDEDNNEQLSGNVRRLLYDEVKKINLVDFISRHAGASFTKVGSSHRTICPMPSHRDTKPSFYVATKDGIWVYGCFGCSSSGTIIDFSKDYWALDHPSEALLLILEKEGMKVDDATMLRAVRDAKVKVDLNFRLECAHVVTAKSCLRLLRRFPGDKSIESWVAKAYMSMNRMLDEQDKMGIDLIGYQALKKLEEKP